MKHIVDIHTWERKDNYNFFRGFANSWISITGEVECTEAYASAKASGRSFFLHYLYAILRAVNEIKELRYRWDKNGQVVYHDTVDVISPIAVPGKTFYTVRIPYREDFEAFYAEARRIVTYCDFHSCRRRSVWNGQTDSRAGRFRCLFAQCHTETVFHFGHLYTAVCRPSIGLSADECGQGHPARRAAVYADCSHRKPCLCRRSAYLAVF